MCSDVFNLVMNQSATQVVTQYGVAKIIQFVVRGVVYLTSDRDVFMMFERIAVHSSVGCKTLE